MKKFGKNYLASFANKYKREIFVLLIIFFSTLFAFSGVFDGKIISNARYLYSFEPWIYYRKEDSEGGNVILSDLIDGKPSRIYMNEEMREGKFPVWNYSDKLGNVGVVNLMEYFYYPFRIIPWLLFGSAVGWSIETIIKFTLGGFFMYLLLKKFNIRSWPALLVAVGFMLGGTQLAESQTEYSTVTLTAPIVFYFLERFFQHSTWKNSLWLLFSLLLLLTSSFVSVIFFFSFWVSAYSLFRVIFTIEKKKKVFVKLFVTAMIAMIISAFVLLPTAEFFTNDTGINLDYRESYGLRQAHIFGSLTLIASNLFGHPLLDKEKWTYGSFVNLTIFLGYFSFLSALIGGLIRLINKREFKTIIIVVFVGLLFFEVYSLPFEQLETITNKLPFFHGNPAMYQKSVLQFMIAILAGLGFDYILKNNFSKKIKEGLFIFISSTVITGISIWTIRYFFYRFNDYSDNYMDYVPSIINTIIVIWGIFNIIVFKDYIFSKLQGFLSSWVAEEFSKEAKGLVLFINIIMIILFINYLTEINLNIKDWIPYARANEWYPQSEMTNYLKGSLKYSRVLPIGEGVAVPAILEAYGLPVAAGRMPVSDTYKAMLQNAYPKAYVDHPTQVVFQEFETNLSDKVWDLVDVRYFVASRNIDKEKVKKEYGEGIKIIELSDSTLLEKNPIPKHAWLVNDGVVFNSVKEMAEGTKEDWNIYENIAFLSDKYLLDNDSAIKDAKIAVKGEILDYKQDTNSISIRLKNEEPTYLIVSSSFYPGWKVTIDGVESRIIPAYGFLKAIQIENSGEHNVELVFRPDSLAYGAIISVFGLLSAGIFYTFAIRREKHITSK